MGAILAVTPLGSEFEKTVGLPWLFKIRGPIEAPADVVVVAIDGATGRTLDLPRLPRDWPRTVHAQLIDDQLLNAVRPARDAPIDEGLANAALAAMHAIAPRDEIQAMLASQMVATHAAAMDMMGQTHRAKYRHTLQDNGNLAVKLLRTYSAQLEALQRYRGKGQQKVTVEHVHVHKGGQAIVGNVEARTQGGGATSKTEGRPHAKQLAHAPEPTLSCADPEREAVPVPRSQR